MDPLSGFRLGESTEIKSDSPFQKYADIEGFRLSYVERSYTLLTSILPKIPNYYTLLEEQARSSPHMAEELYQSLREGMELSPEQFAAVHMPNYDI